MRVRKARLVTSFVLGAIACSAAQAQSSPPATQFTIGAKVWHAAWLSYVPAPYTGVAPNGLPAIGDSINAVEGKERTSVMPQLLVRHGKYFASVTHGQFKSDFHVPTSPLITPTGQNLITSRTDHFKRRESDLAAGYFVTPEVGIALGYKDATETRDTSLGIAPQRTPVLRTRAKALLLGAVGSFAVYERLRLNVQAAYGPARLRLKFTDPALGSSKSDGSYVIGEVGLSYPLFTSPSGYGGATASIGYRTQTVKAEYRGVTLEDTRDLRDVRDGVVVSLNFTL